MRLCGLLLQEPFWQVKLKKAGGSVLLLDRIRWRPDCQLIHQCLHHLCVCQGFFWERIG